MINTHVIIGEYLTLKETWQALLNRKDIYYQSKKKWFLSTLGILLPITSLSGIILFIVLCIMNHSTPQTSSHSWEETILISFLCPTIIIPPTLIGTYIQSFVTIRKMAQTLSDFVNKWFSKDTKLIVQPISLNYFIKTADNWEIEIALIKANANGFKESHIITAIYILPFDKFEEMAKTIKEWYEYCHMKKSCQNLYLERNIAYALFSIDENVQENVLETIDQMKYLIQRFNIPTQRMIYDDIDQDKAKTMMQTQQS
ncbi:MAG: hypothetical protein IJ916_01915 [Paludibacteraceae bacterium]|nr:hypothetical protein [Paludibacteraceae bacterium]